MLFRTGGAFVAPGCIPSNTELHMSNQIQISVIICTYNRGQIFKDTLESFAGMDLPMTGSFELLLVDNCSTDDTQRIAKDFVRENSGYAHYLFEGKQGLSHARNSGIAASKGAVVAFIDDDVYLDQGWLKAMLEVFQSQSDAVAIGGRSMPQFEGGRPDWITDDLLTFYGSTNSGDKTKKMIYPEHPFGLNMAFRREVFNMIGDFGTHLGRKKNNLLSNEESDLFLRIHNAGLKVIYTPNALLYHRIPANRARKDWIISRHYWQGISDIAFHQYIEPDSKAHLLRIIFQDIRKLISSITGGHHSPRKAYWHFKAIQLRERNHQAYLWGGIVQMMQETLSFRK